MSLLNFWTEGDRGLLSVDTQSLSADGNRIDRSRLAVLPHAAVALGGRGHLLCLGARVLVRPIAL